MFSFFCCSPLSSSPSSKFGLRTLFSHRISSEADLTWASQTEPELHPLCLQQPEFKMTGMFIKIRTNYQEKKNLKTSFLLGDVVRRQHFVALIWQFVYFCLHIFFPHLVSGAICLLTATVATTKAKCSVASLCSSGGSSSIEGAASTKSVVLGERRPAAKRDSLWEESASSVGWAAGAMQALCCSRR